MSRSADGCAPVDKAHVLLCNKECVGNLGRPFATSRLLSHDYYLIDSAKIEFKNNYKQSAPSINTNTHSSALLSICTNKIFKFLSQPLSMHYQNINSRGFGVLGFWGFTSFLV